MISGLIPAHAGKTTRHSGIPCGRRAHPRSRGENTLASLTGCEIEGSSPLTRGKLGQLISAFAPLRLIPAHAGKTPRRAGRPTLRAGSSPLTRGKPDEMSGRQKRKGLIPAHAGKTAEVNVSHFRFPAHPRSRGENGSALPLTRGDAGSSPLTRGKLLTEEGERRFVGLIPAHAGKTRKVPLGASGQAAHPRSRGENKPIPIQRSAPCGSSPLTRGKRCCFGHR